MTVHVYLHAANDRNGKAPGLRSAVIRGPSGLRFDTGTVTECTASDDQIRAMGPSACPSDSRLAIGSFSAWTGFGPPFDPLPGDDQVFDGPNQLIEIITFPGAPASPAFDRLTISGSTLTAHPPTAPGGPPDGETTVRSLDFQIPVRVTAGRSLIRTPRRCPATGQWPTTATFVFADGSTDTVTSHTPCTHASGHGGGSAGRGSQQPRLRLAVHPRHVRAGQRLRVRLRVSSSAKRCISGARVRLGGRTVRTDGRGRAKLAMTFHVPGRRRARATSPGCQPAIAHVGIGSGHGR
jgi:hypothetical protein